MSNNTLLTALDKAVNSIPLTVEEITAISELKYQLETTNDAEQILQILTAIIRLIGIASNLQDLIR
jgi:hypothetical protein